MSLADKKLAIQGLVNHYPGKGVVAVHVSAVLEAYDSLQPKVEAFVFDDGRSQLLLCLSGVIPVRLRGNTYNCPLALWLPLDYPAKAPITLILPTSNMQIKRSQSVDPNGKVTIPYLEGWERKREGCSVMELLQVLQEHFGKEYPLVSISAKPAPPSAAASTSAAIPSISHSSIDQPSSRPPLPLSASRPPLEIQQINLYGDHAPTVGRDMHEDSSRMAYANRDSSFQSIQSPLITNRPPFPTPIPQSYSSNSPPTRPAVPLATSHYQQQNLHEPSQQQQQQTVRQPPQQYSNGTFPTSTYAHPPIPPQPLQHTPQQYHQQQQQQLQQQQQQQPYRSPPRFNTSPSSQLHRSTAVASFSSSSLPRATLPTRQQQHRQAINILDGPDDPFAALSISTSLKSPPPLPPHPELLAIRSRLHAKLTHSLSLLHRSTQERLNELSLVEADLQLGEPAIVDEMQRLEAVRGVCENVAKRYEDVVILGERRLEEYRARGDGPEVDEIVCSTEVVYNQLMDLMAEDAAIEDTLYHLGRGLYSETANIDLDRFLKRVRNLAIKQFEKRYLINQIVAGLP